jgi:hypothetical protein
MIGEVLIGLLMIVGFLVLGAVAAVLVTRWNANDPGDE